ncbi:hypothetical protein NDA13_003941 [Ustilago tritici]|nr:hypothetical protein NDA13_003941 [Ustilago tritici]
MVKRKTIGSSKQDNGESPEGDAGDSTDSRAIGDKRQRHDDMREETSTAIDRRPLASGETSRLNPPEFLEEDPEEEIIDVCVDRVFARMKAGLQAETRPRVKIDKQVQTDPPTQTEQKVQADQQVQTEEQGRSGEQPKPGTQAQLEVKMQVGAQMRSEAHVHIDLQLKLSTAPA